MANRWRMETTTLHMRQIAARRKLEGEVDSALLPGTLPANRAVGVFRRRFALLLVSLFSLARKDNRNGQDPSIVALSPAERTRRRGQGRASRHQ